MIWIFAGAADLQVRGQHFHLCLLVCFGGAANLKFRSHFVSTFVLVFGPMASQCISVQCSLLVALWPGLRPVLKRTFGCSSIVSSLSGLTNLKTHSKRIAFLYILFWKQCLARSRTQLWVQKPAHVLTCSEASTELQQLDKIGITHTLLFPPVAVVIFGVCLKFQRSITQAGKPKSSFGVCQLLGIF